MSKEREDAMSEAWNLAQPEQEHVGIVRIIGGYPDNSERVVEWVRPYKYLKDGDKLYLAPKREPLSEDKLDVLAEANITDEELNRILFGF